MTRVYFTHQINPVFDPLIGCPLYRGVIISCSWVGFTDSWSVKKKKKLLKALLFLCLSDNYNNIYTRFIFSFKYIILLLFTSIFSILLNWGLLVGCNIFRYNTILAPHGSCCCFRLLFQHGNWNSFKMEGYMGNLADRKIKNND